MSKKKGIMTISSTTVTIHSLTFVSFATEAVDSLGEDLTSLFATGHFHTEVGAVVPADDVLASVLLAQMEFVQSDNVITSGDLLQPLLDTLEMFEKQPGFLPTNITEHFANEFDQRETFALFLQIEVRLD